MSIADIAATLNQSFTAAVAQAEAADRAEIEEVARRMTEAFSRHQDSLAAVTAIDMQITGLLEKRHRLDYDREERLTQDIRGIQQEIIRIRDRRFSAHKQIGQT